MSKIIVTKSDDTFEAREFEGYKTIGESVEGFFEICGHLNLKGIQENISVYCNEEFLIDNDERFNSVNALASILCEQPIYGNVMIAIDVDTPDGIETGGFDEKGLAVIESLLTTIQKEGNLDLKRLHLKYDRNKPEPRMEFVSFDNKEDFFKAMRSDDGYDR